MKTRLYGTSYMRLDLSQVGIQISQLQNQNQTGNNNIFSPGSAGATKFEHLIQDKGVQVR